MITVDPESAFGDRIERLATLAELEDSYSHTLGSMTLDLTQLRLPAGTTRTRASTSFGSVQAFGQELSGIDAERVIESPNYGSAERRLDIRVESAFGSVEVFVR